MTSTPDLEALRGRYVVDVPTFGRLALGIGAGASYAAAKKGEIPTVSLGRTLRVITEDGLHHIGLSDDVVHHILGLPPPERSDAAPSQDAASANAPTNATVEGTDTHDEPSTAVWSTTQPRRTA